MINCLAYDSHRCKSCSLIKYNYEDGLTQKITFLSSYFDPNLFNKPIKSSPIIGYRNKAKFVIGGSLEDPIIGIPSINNNQLVSPLTDCPLHTDTINKLAQLIRSSIAQFKLTPYNIEKRTGEFKYLIISQGYKTNELSIRFGMRSLESFERVKKLYKLLLASNKNINVCSFEVQPKHASIFEGKEIFLSENKYIQHDFESIQLFSSTSNFFQVNSKVAKSLYDKINTRFQNENICISVDLFCGVGGFGQQLLKFSNQVYGIELNSVAIDCANYSVKSNNLSNIEFICDDANNFDKYIKGKVDLLVVNPPRRGIGAHLCELIKKINPKFLIYSSCNTKTLSKDINLLTTHYKIESITPVDMFPLTRHLEVLCILERI